MKQIQGTYQTLLCRFEGLGREEVQAEQPGFVIGGTGTETIYQQKNGGLGYLVFGCPLTSFALRKLGLFEFIFLNN